jgi:hypothetical protein
MSGFFQVTFKKRDGKEKKIIVPPKRIFLYPEDDDDPYIFWVLEKQFAPAFKCKKGNKNIIVMNFHSLKGMKDCPNDIADIPIYLSAVLIEELTHCADSSMKNHKKWINILGNLQGELR